MEELIIESFSDKYLSQTEILIRSYPDIFSREEFSYFREDLLHNLLEKASHKKDIFVLILRVESDVRGAVVINKPQDSSSYFKIHWLIVKEGFQGEGYGTKLMKEAFHLIREQKGKYVFLETSHEKYNEPTKKFYEHLGLKEMAVLPNYYDPPSLERHRPEDCVMFFKEL